MSERVDQDGVTAQEWVRLDPGQAPPGLLEQVAAAGDSATVASAGPPDADQTPGGRRSGRSSRWRTSPAPAAPAPDPAARPQAGPDWTRRGHQLVTSARRARSDYYAPMTPAAPTTTRQAEILNTGLIAAPTDADGIIVGRDMLSSAIVAHDQFTAYRRKQISSPNVIVVGAVGSGKSSLLKTVYVLRPLVLKRRRVVLLDKKDRDGEGENAELTRVVTGNEPMRFTLEPADTTRINVMDPLILAGTGLAGQVLLLGAMAEFAQDEEPLSIWQREALQMAHRAVLAAAEAANRVPMLEDLTRQLRQVADLDGAREYTPSSRERLAQEGLTVSMLLGRLLSDELGGIFSGPTSKHVNLSQRLTTFDVSQLPETGPAVSMVVSVANAWLMGVLRHDRGWLTNFIAEEGWHLVGGPGGRVFQANSKLARGLGLSNITALHHLSDAPADSPAIAMVKEAQTVHVFRQDREDDIDACVQLFGLQPGSKSTIANLDDGHHLLKISNRPEIHVHHVRSDLEVQLTDTDSAMTLNQGRG